jgi:hypothetical protein
MPTIEKLIQTIDGRIREVEREIASLQDARSALTANGGRPGTSREPVAKPRPQVANRAPRRNATRKPEVLLAETAERMLAESEGLTTTAIAKQAGAERDQVLALLRDLEAASRIRRTGERRGTRWHAITDDDRVAARAAELEARSRRRTS